MRAIPFLLLALTACGDGSAELTDAAPFVLPDSAMPAAKAPLITSFIASPNLVSSGFATDVRFSWTYDGLPYPAASCTIDNGIGAITSGTMKSVTLTANTTYTLMCSNASGTASRPVIVSVPAVAPNLSTFVATPATVVTNVATNVAWTWTYTSPPSPAPTCSISPTVGTVTNGQVIPVTQAAGVTYTLTCVNSAGSRQRTLFVASGTPPAIATFTATPSTVTTNVATTVTFAWTFSNAPTPTPTCSIDQNIGAITSGSARTVTLAATTVFTLTCMNAAGMAMQPVTITAQ